MYKRVLSVVFAFVALAVATSAVSVEEIATEKETRLVKMQRLDPGVWKSCGHFFYRNKVNGSIALRPEGMGERFLIFDYNEVVPVIVASKKTPTLTLVQRLDRSRLGAEIVPLDRVIQFDERQARLAQLCLPKTRSDPRAV